MTFRIRRESDVWPRPLTGGYAEDGSRVGRAEEWVGRERVCEFRLRSGRCSIAAAPGEPRLLFPALLIVLTTPRRLPCSRRKLHR